MYRIKIKDSVYTIPKENIKLLALQKAIQTGYNKPIQTNEQAIECLTSMGCTVEERWLKNE